MKIHEFPIKSPLCHCERSRLGVAKQSRLSVLTEIASSSRGKTPRNDKLVVLALGAESAGNFMVFTNPPLIKGAGGIFFSDNFGDLLDDINFKKFKKVVLDFLKKNKLKPNIILTDLHPLYKTTIWGAELAKKFSAEHIYIQHHLAHIFSAIGETAISNFQFSNKLKITNSFYGIALDGTGYGFDGRIWGGEVFQLSTCLPVGKVYNYQLTINRIGHLENQTMIGGDLAVKEPARMLIAIIAKIKNQKSKIKITDQNLKLDNNKFVYNFVKKYYTKNQFELLYNQLQNNFNCVETSSTGRILDAVSLLLGFCKNERNYKHEPINLLEKNSTTPYANLKPKITYNLQLTTYNLLTTPLFEYLTKNLHKDKRRLAATAQLYIAEGLNKIISQLATRNSQLFLSGGISDNKIISNYFKSKGAYTNKIIPRGDAGISFGQIIYYLNNP